MACRLPADPRGYPPGPHEPRRKGPGPWQGSSPAAQGRLTARRTAAATGLAWTRDRPWTLCPALSRRACSEALAPPPPGSAAVPRSPTQAAGFPAEPHVFVAYRAFTGFTIGG
jgi:hypothetical protein